MNLINSKNRTQAKRLLNNFHDSREVRVWTMQQLNDALQRAINSGLLTLAGAQRALGITSRDENESSHSDRAKRSDNNDAEKDDGDDDMQSHHNNEEGDNGTEGDDDGGNDASKGDEKGEGEEGDEGESESGEDGNEESESEEQNGNGDGDSEEDESESEGDDKSQSGDDEGDNEDDNNDDDDQSQEDGKSEGEEGEDEKEEEQQEEDEEEEEDDSEQFHDSFKTIMKWIQAGVNVALVGPAGSGKSYIARQVARHLDRGFRVNGAMMSKYDLIGYKDANGTYHDTPAYDAFVNGHIHCFDEADASAPDAMVAFNGMTDDQPFFTFPNGQQEKHPDYIAVCCMNTWGNGATSEYVGRYKQDAASMTRFVKVLVDYDRKIEAKIAGKKNLDIAQRVWDLRDACESLGIRHVVSTRMIIQGVKGRAVKCNKTDIDRDVLFAGLDEGAVRQLKTKMNEIARLRSNES